MWEWCWLPACRARPFGDSREHPEGFGSPTPKPLGGQKSSCAWLPRGRACLPDGRRGGTLRREPRGNPRAGGSPWCNNRRVLAPGSLSLALAVATRFVICLIFLNTVESEKVLGGRGTCWQVIWVADIAVCKQVFQVPPNAPPTVGVPLGGRNIKRASSFPRHPGTRGEPGDIRVAQSPLDRIQSFCAYRVSSATVSDATSLRGPVVPMSSTQCSRAERTLEKRWRIMRQIVKSYDCLMKPKKSGQ